MLNTVAHFAHPGGGSLHCHEISDYDDENDTFTLTAFVAICDACQSVVHAGRPRAHGGLAPVLMQLSGVNGLSPAEAKRVAADAFALWRQRNKRDWKVFVGPELLEQYPALSVLEGRCGKAAGSP